MNQASALQQLGTTQQKLLRQLLVARQGATVEELCEGLGITHNAVRQHLTALIFGGFVGRGAARPTGGRPQLRYVLTATGRELFPRKYGLIATGLIDSLQRSAGKEAVRELLTQLGHELGREAASRIEAGSDDDIAATLADQLDALGYEAVTARHDGETQIEAYNCVFHEIAKAHPDVCRFDLAFMESATGRPIEQLECLQYGGRACRFRIKPATSDTEPDADES
ncbi:MAG: MarR family transcriptional regulator [Dokdonella sp.]|nr:MAG: MarR family transcriptional regulator [Dokdonella sp.]